MRASLASARRAVVVGAGFNGLECAAVARESGCVVTVVEALDRPPSQSVSARTAEYFTRLHPCAGTRLLFGPAQGPGVWRPCTATAARA
ncbi:FAD/NAD(P)-binding oxidoreductase [Streptomyces sp. NPDC052309]|uniref:FAD/NAD(P)-binding oxidoreductase n=1 Tax=Streptomyces sp. NPDC052309 TaxID=3155421 RepID=UPI00341813F0